jgi:regulatory protein
MGDTEGFKEKKTIKISDPKVGLEKAQNYCAYQERSQQEVRDKLYSWGLWKDAVEDIISSLIQDNFINEERFAKIYAGGKFRIKKWGRVKIKHALQLKGVSTFCIKKGLSEIDDDAYMETLKELLSEKLKSIKEKNPLAKKYKAAAYAISRGFESDLVWGLLKD